MVETASVVEGQTFEGRFDGPGELYVRVDFGDWQRVSVDPESGRFTMTAPVGSFSIGFSTRSFEKTSQATIVEVFSTSSP
ncbi:MAG: hypothetical protein AAF628_33195 [Planctomycetota bacterium]